MFTVMTIVHILACIFLVLVVLLQTGKGADMGAVFGGSSSTVFGSSGAGNLLTKLTTATAIVFMLTSLGPHLFLGPAQQRNRVRQRAGDGARARDGAPGGPPGCTGARSRPTGESGSSGGPGRQLIVFTDRLGPGTHSPHPSAREDGGTGRRARLRA